MHFITLFVTSLVTLSSIDGIQYTLAKCDCDPANNECIDSCINEARSCIADCNTEAVNRMNNSNRCHTQCLESYWPEIDFEPQIKVQEEEILDNVEDDLDQEDDEEASTFEKVMLHENDEEEEDEEETYNDKELSKELDSNTQLNYGSKVSSQTKEEEKDEEEYESEDELLAKIDVQQVDELSSMDDDADEKEEKEDVEQEYQQHLEKEDLEDNNQQHHNYVFAVNTSHKKQDVQEIQDKEENDKDVTQQKASSAEEEKALHTEQAYYNNEELDKNKNNEPISLRTITEFTTVTSHVTVLPNGHPVSATGGPSSQNASNINGSSGTMQVSCSIVTLTAIICAYLIV